MPVNSLLTTGADGTPLPPSSAAEDVHPVIVSAVLGHASPAFTVAVYQHA
jgi:hypothetical protein